MSPANRLPYGKIQPEDFRLVVEPVITARIIRIICQIQALKPDPDVT